MVTSITFKSKLQTTKSSATPASVLCIARRSRRPDSWKLEDELQRKLKNARVGGARELPKLPVPTTFPAADSLGWPNRVRAQVKFTLLSRLKNSARNRNLIRSLIGT